ncbi:hypothetical protein BDZ91DRAFT_762698 [Kalaharituber pfeilii]|nr:hypothetical protein BDZ91DRAFT_762698 [Kalaharituber pfeilii]
MGGAGGQAHAPRSTPPGRAATGPLAALAARARKIAGGRKQASKQARSKQARKARPGQQQSIAGCLAGGRMQMQMQVRSTCEQLPAHTAHPSPCQCIFDDDDDDDHGSPQPANPSVTMHCDASSRSAPALPESIPRCACDLLRKSKYVGNLAAAWMLCLPLGKGHAAGLICVREEKHRSHETTRLGINKVKKGEETS